MGKHPRLFDELSVSYFLLLTCGPPAKLHAIALVPDLSFSETKFLSRFSNRQFGATHTTGHANSVNSDLAQPIEASVYFARNKTVDANRPQEGSIRLSDNKPLIDIQERVCSSKTHSTSQCLMLPEGQGNHPMQRYSVANERDVESRVESSNRSTSCYTWSGTNSEPPSTSNVRQQWCGGLPPPIPVLDDGLHNSVPVSEGLKPATPDGTEYSLDTESKVKRMVFRNAYIPRSTQLEVHHSNRSYSLEELVGLAKTALSPIKDGQDIQPFRDRTTSNRRAGSPSASEITEKGLNHGARHESNGLCEKIKGVRRNGNFSCPRQERSIRYHRHSIREISMKHALGNPRQSVEPPLSRQGVKWYTHEVEDMLPEPSIRRDTLERVDESRLHHGSGHALDGTHLHASDAANFASSKERYEPHLDSRQSIYCRHDITPMVTPPPFYNRLPSFNPYEGTFRPSEGAVSCSPGIHNIHKNIDLATPDALPIQFWRPNKLY